MARDKRVRLSDEEFELLDDVHSERWEEDVAGDVPYAKTIKEALETLEDEVDNG